MYKPNFDPKERSLLSMLVDLLVADPEGYAQVGEVELHGEPLQDALRRIVEAFEAADQAHSFERLSLQERGELLREITDRIAARDDHSARIAAHTLRWAMDNQASGRPA